MIEFYPQLKAIHTAAVMASGLLFLIRGAPLHGGMSWPMAAPVRYTTYAIDTVLLVYGFIISVARAHHPAGLFASAGLSL